MYSIPCQASQPRSTSTYDAPPPSIYDPANALDVFHFTSSFHVPETLRDHVTITRLTPIVNRTIICVAAISMMTISLALLSSIPWLK